MALLGVPTSRDHIQSALEANLRRAYLDSYSKVAERGFYKRIYNVVNTGEKIVRDAVYAGVGTYSAKDEGAAPDYDSGQEAWNQSYTPRTFTLGIQVTKEAQEDDKHGVIRWMISRGGSLAKTAWYTKERDAMNLFNSKLTSGTVYTAGGTNYPLLSTSHFLVTGGTWTNRPANDLDLSIEALEFMWGHWLINQVNQRGQILMSSPDRLMVGASDGPLALRLVNTVRGRPQSADNDINLASTWFKEDPIIHPLLTNDGRWLVFCDKSETGLNYFERVLPNIERWPDADNGNMRLVGRYRSEWGATTVSGIWGSP